MIPPCLNLLGRQQCGPCSAVNHKGARICRKKLAALKQIGDPMSFRAAESASRPKAVEGARQLLELIGKSANAWPTIKPWLNETDIKGLTDQVSQPAAYVIPQDLWVGLFSAFWPSA